MVNTVRTEESANDSVKVATVSKVVKIRHNLQVASTDGRQRAGPLNQVNRTLVLSRKVESTDVAYLENCKIRHIGETKGSGTKRTSINYQSFARGMEGISLLNRFTVQCGSKQPRLISMKIRAWGI